MKLENKFTALIIILISGTILIISFFSLSMIRGRIEEDTGARLLDTGRVVASVPLVQETLASKGISTMKVQNFVENLRLKTKVLFIIVMDMDGKKYSHPIPANIGLDFNENDNYRVLQYGESYVSQEEDILGYSIRSFVPVYFEGEQVGAVSVGILTGDMLYELKKYTNRIMPVMLLTLVVSILGARILARSIKKSIFGLEPSQIAFILSERESIINNVHDGLIAINITGDIRLMNTRAQEILKITSRAQVPGVIIDNLMETMYRRSRVFNKEIRLDDNVIMANFYTIFGDDGNVKGGVASIQDMTIVTNMAEELTGVKELFWNLRAQNHEFMNKLHTIAGLIQLEEYDKAIEYIFNTTSTRGLVTDSLRNIKEVSIQGLIFAKYNRADEAKIKFEVDDGSNFKEVPKDISLNELLVIIGNLIQNSIEEVTKKNDGYIFVGIYQDTNIKIVVKNNGSMIDDEVKKSIFNRGYSTKGKYRGMGLYNINEIVGLNGGTINLTSDENETIWEIVL